MTITFCLVPLNAVYDQYPFELEPSEFWNCSRGHWVDISNTYENLFFRVNGDKSRFGKVQEENKPRIDWVKYSECKWSEDDCTNDDSDYQIIKEGWSHTLNTGFTYDLARQSAIKNLFHSTGGEVRPRNMAIKIWKCVS